MNSRLSGKASSVGAAVFWSIALAVSIITVPLLLQVALKISGTTLSLNAPILLLSLSLIGSVMMGLIFVAISWAVRRPITWKDVAFNRPLTWKDIGFAIAGFVLYIICSAIAMYVFRQLGGNVDQPQEFGLGSLFGLDRLYAMVIFVVLVPIIEEVIFRGMLYSKLRKARLHMVFASVIVSVLFGIAHGQWNVAVDVFVMSMVLCYLREFTGSIWAGVVIHMIKNAIGFYFTFVLLQGGA